MTAMPLNYVIIHYLGETRKERASVYKCLSFIIYYIETAKTTEQFIGQLIDICYFKMSQNTT
jgi:hypothetical protein